MSASNTKYGLVAALSAIAIIINTLVRWPPFEAYYGIGDALSIWVWVSIPLLLIPENKFKNVFYWVWWLVLGNLMDEATDRYMICTGTEIAYAGLITAWFICRSLKSR